MMKKLFLFIFAMFLISPMLSQAKQVDHYAGKTSVDDGLGGEWKVEKKKYLRKGTRSQSAIRVVDSTTLIAALINPVFDESDYHNVYRIYRLSDQVFNSFVEDMRTRRFGNGVVLNEKSLPPEAGVNAAFYGYLSEIKKAKDALSVYFWIDLATGKVTEVGFEFEAESDSCAVFSIPPWRFTMYERILKETVLFDSTPELRTQKQIIENGGMAAGVYVVFAGL